MRQEFGRQLARYLLAAWVIGVLALIAMIAVTHKTIHQTDWIVIVGTACIMGGLLWHFFEFWVYEEHQKEKKRGLH